MAEDKIKSLYKAFLDEGYAMEPEADFRKNLADSTKRRAAYDALVGDGYDMEPYEDFERNIGFGAQATEPAKPMGALENLRAKAEEMYNANRAGTDKTEEATQPADSVAGLYGQVPTLEADASGELKIKDEELKINVSDNSDVSDGALPEWQGDGGAYMDARLRKMRGEKADFDAALRGRGEAVRRDVARYTPEGRARQKQGEMTARIMGAPTRLFGLTGEAGASPEIKNNNLEIKNDGVPATGVSPEAYGVRMGDDGKVHTEWLMPDGSLTTDMAVADHAEYAAREARMRDAELKKQKMADVLPDAVERAWGAAAGKEREERALEERGAIPMAGPNALEMPDFAGELRRRTAHKRAYNLEAMADEIYNGLPEDYRHMAIEEAKSYFRTHPEALPEGMTLGEAAERNLRATVWQGVYDKAMQANVPKSRTEFFLRKMMDNNLVNPSMGMDIASSVMAGTWGEASARDMAMAEYGKEHRVLDIAGTIAGIMSDPTTYVSGAVGSAAGKAAMQVAGKRMLSGAGREMAERFAARTLTGRVIGGAAGGAANFATYETLQNALQQVRYGGMIDPETGEHGDFALGELLKAGAHGLVLGSVTGAMSPLLGNVADKAVKATANTAGKTAVRAGEVAVSTVAEGTVFAIPEWMSGEGDAFDVWTDNIAMMAGFKASHGIKSAPRVIAGLRPVKDPGTQAERNHNRQSFVERLRKNLDASPRDFDFSKDEMEELRSAGYGDMAELFRRSDASDHSDKSDRPDGWDGVLHDVDGYEAMAALVQDGRVSEAARAKAYYILTGRQLPMSSITGWSTVVGDDGRIAVRSVNAQGDVVTSRTFGSKREADAELGAIRRQAELNTIDMGERYREGQADAAVFAAAVKATYPDADLKTVRENYARVKSGDENATDWMREQAAEIEEAIELNRGAGDAVRPEKIRAGIKEETGVDVDAAVRKQPGKRTEAEQQAVQMYMERLYPEDARRKAEPSPERQAAQRVYEDSKLLYGRFEQGNAEERAAAQAEVDEIGERWREALEACEDAFGAEAEVRMAEMKDNPWLLLDDPELTADQQDAVLAYVNARMALEGVQDAAAAEARASAKLKIKNKELKIKEIEDRTHKDAGVVIPAVMKAGDRQVYVVKGRVAMHADGSGVDVRSSDQSVVVFDPEEGRAKFASPDQILRVEEPRDARAELDAALAEVEAQRNVFPERDMTEKENSGNVLLTEEESLNLQTDNTAEDAVSERISQTDDREEDGKAEALSRVLDVLDAARARAAGREGSPAGSREAGRSGASVSRQEIEARAAETHAKETGTWIPMRGTFNLGRPGPSGNENDTFISPDNQYYYKVNNLMNSGGEISQLLEKVRLHNELFPETAYEYVGMTGYDGRSVYPVLRQPLVADAVSATPEEIADYMSALGYERTGEHSWSNGTYEVSDMRPRNVLKDADGDIYVVDAEIKKKQTALSRIPTHPESGEPMFEAVDKETAWDGLVEAAGGERDAAEIVEAQVAQASAELEMLKKKPPVKKAPKLTGSPMAMAKAKREAAEAYDAAVAEHRQLIAAAEARMQAWYDIAGVNTSRNAARRAQEEAERKQRDADAQAAAQARFEQEQRSKAEKQAEQEAVGTHAVNPKIKERWDAALKVEGNADAITLPDGSAIRGRYVLTEAGAASASHDAGNAYVPTEGFPVDENGQSVNDRDYERDKDAQRIVEQMAAAYDSRAMQTPVVVSRDGVVLSGNNRTMSGDLAARQGTDKAYVDYLREFGAKYGFTPEQVQGMRNPRLVFVPDESLPYDASTFARFNAQETKSQSKPEAAVKLGKVVPDEVFGGIVDDIASYDRLSDYYGDEKAVARALGALMQAGVINDKQMPEMRTGTALSATGKELIENVLIGKVFQSSPDAVRRIVSMPGLRQSVVMGLGEVATNRALADAGYDLSAELADAVKLVHDAKTSMPDVYGEGVPVSPFGRQAGLFDDEMGESRVTDGATLLLADMLNSGRPSDLRKVLAAYNAEAAASASGQVDMFTGAVPTKEEILTTINEHFRNATPKEQQAMVDAAIAERKRRAEDIALMDNQGNPIDENGNLIVESVESVDAITDKDFTEPYRTVGLPPLPEKVANAIGLQSAAPIIKKNVFDKNKKHHKDLTPEDGRIILNQTLYNPQLYGQNQKTSRPYNWILVHLADKNSSVVVEVNNPDKDNAEIVNWHYIGGAELERKKRQAVKEGGLILTLSEDNAAADTHDDLLSDSKGSQKTSDKQESSAERKADEDVFAYAARVAENERARRAFAEQDADREADLEALRQEQTDGLAEKAAEAQAEADSYKADIEREVEPTDEMSEAERDASRTFHKGDGPSERNAEVYEAAKGLLETAGVKVHEVSGEQAQAMLGGDAAELSAARKRALDTLNGGSAQRSDDTGLRTSHQDPVVSFDDAAKIQKKLESLAERYEGISKEHTFIGDLAKALGLRNNGNRSNYGTFEAKNGTVVRVRISDHNAEVRNFDDAGYDNGISIVVSRKGNAGLNNNGTAHIVEYFYNGYKLAKAEGHPLAEIARSMKQLLFSGEFKDTTGLAERQEVNAGTVALSAARKRALDTVVGSEERHSTVVSSADGAKIIKNLDALASNYQLKPNGKEQSFIGRLSEALGLRNNGNRSSYGTFETKNGMEVRVRVSDHNANPQNFEDAGYMAGISIVVTSKKNNRMPDIGAAHIVEHYYSAYKLAKAEGHPLAEIVRSMKQALYSGEFKDTTGLAERQEVNGGADAVVLKDGRGTVYGWTEGGEVYLNKDAMNPETPVHEYTHLWDAMVQRENPGLWARGVELMKHTPLWREVLDDAAYADIRDNEDAVASEVHSRLTGARGARVLDDMIKDGRKDGIFEQAASVTLVQQLKRWMAEMYGHLRDTLGKWTRKDLKNLTAEDFADMTLRDLANGVNPRHGDRTMAGVHNISEEKLLKALRAGGLANPSVAVIEPGRSRHEGYGGISLVLPSDKLERGHGGSAGTWAGDAWTPTYPGVERRLTDAGREKVMDDILKLPTEMQGSVRRAFDNWLEGREADDMCYWFLHEKGEAPEVEHRARLYEPAEAAAIVRAASVTDESGVRRTVPVALLGAEARAEVVDAYVKHRFDGDMARYEEEKARQREALVERMKKHPEGSMWHKSAKLKLERMDSTGVLPAVDGWIGEVKADVAAGGRAEPGLTARAARRIIDERGLQGEYARWLDELAERYGVEEVLFDGFTPDGTRKYVPNTVENASRIMRGYGQNGSTGWGGSFSSFVAGVLERMDTRQDMRRERGRLTDDHGRLEEFDAKWSEKYFDLSLKCSNDAAGNYTGDGAARLEEAVGHRNPAAFMEREYGVRLSGEDRKTLDDMLAAIRKERPAMYFETKFERPVRLGEFAAAVVPERTDGKLVAALEDAGLRVVRYNPEKADDRARALAQASDDGSVRFYVAYGNEAEGLEKLGTDERTAVEKYLSERRSAPVRVVATEADVEALGLGEKAAGELVRAISSDENSAVYSLYDKKIYIFAGRDAGAGIESTLLHENVHARLDELGHASEFATSFREQILDHEKDGDVLYDLYEKLSNYYPKKIADEEFLAYAFEWMARTDANMSEYSDRLWSNARDYFDKNFKKYLYERRRENQLAEILSESSGLLAEAGSYGTEAEGDTVGRAGAERAGRQAAAEGGEPFAGNEQGVIGRTEAEKYGRRVEENQERDIQSKSTDAHDKREALFSETAGDAARGGDRAEGYGRRVNEDGTAAAGNERGLARERAVSAENGAKRFRDGESAGERLLAIRRLEPVEVEGNSLSKAELQEVYRNLPSVEKDGREIEFYHSAFKKIYKDGGLFGQIVPVLDEVLEQSVLAYSEEDGLGGTVRPDGTVHKEHPNVDAFDNYVGKVTLDGKEYYVRTTVQRSERSTAGTHSFMVTQVDVYENTANGLSLPITTRARGTKDGIVDAKLQQFFERASAELLPQDMCARAVELSEKLHTPVRLITDLSDLSDDSDPSARRKRRAKGWATDKGEIVIVVPNNVNVADIENTVVHEIVGHDGLRAFIGAERFDRFLDEVYGHAGAGIRKEIDKRAERMVAAEADRLTRQKGGDVFAAAEAWVEARVNRDKHRREATEEYMADMAGRIGDRGFEKMSEEELTLWGRVKAMVQKFLDRFMRGLNIPKSWTLTDKHLAYILYKGWRFKRDGGRADVFAKAEDVVMRERTGYDKPELEPVSEKSKEEARGTIVADRVVSLFEDAVSGKLTGKPVEVGKLTQDGRAFLERLSGMKLKEDVSFVLNPSDLMHIYRRHFGQNEHDGRNIPLTLEDIKAIAEIISNPDKVIYAKEKKGNERNMFFFLKGDDTGSYNLLEVYADRKGNLTSKSFFKSKEGVSQRVISLQNDPTLYVRDGWGNPLDDAKLPKFFDYPKSENSETEKGKFIDSLNAFSNGVAENEFPSSGYKGATLESLLQVSDEDVRYRSDEDAGKKNTVGSEAALKHLEPSSNGGRNMTGREARLNDLDPASGHAAKVMEKLEIAKAGLMQVAETYRGVTEPKGFLTDLGKSIGIIMGRGGSGYRTFELQDGRILKIRLSTHNANAENAKTGEPVVSVAIKPKRTPNTFISDNERVVDEYVYFKEDIRKAPAGTLSSIAESISELLDTGEYVDRTGLARENHSPESGRIRFRDGDDMVAKRPVLARALYEQRVASATFQVREAMQDSMLGLLELYRAIDKASGEKRYIEDVPDYQNAYVEENLMSSRNQAEQTAYEKLVIKPMLNEVAKLARDEKEYGNLLTYMMAKHGLERNVLMRDRAEADGVSRRTADATDYAGLTGLFKTDDVVDAENQARRLVGSFETANDTAPLWEKVNAATKATLSKLKEGGLISRESRDKIAGMYDCYVPLRGWCETTADEVYGYMARNDSNLRGSVLKKADGRTSVADDPIATIAMMGQQAIAQANRNKMKQAFLTYVLKHPSDLVSVNQLWLRKSDVTGEWEPVFASNINDGDDAATVEQKISDFEGAMKRLASAEPDKYKSGRQARGIPYKIGNGNLGEHTVLVRRGDYTYVLTVNGNPRAAQALNGLTNPDVGTGAGAALFKIGEELNHFISPIYTTRNPDFMLRNFLRDAFYANTMTWVRESPKYAGMFMWKFLRENPFHMAKLISAYNSGTLDMRKQTHRYFHEFIMNGGETGYTNQADIRKQKKAVDKMLKRARKKVSFGKVLEWFADQWDLLNGAAENAARFATYVTSREMGRTIQRSVYDAKEVSVNFNKKGAGAKFMGATGQTAAGNAAAFVSGAGRGLYVFWNATVQATFGNFFKNAGRHPFKMAGAMVSMFLLGVMQGILGAKRDDDEETNDRNRYFDQPDFVRRSNLLVKVGDMLVAHPLPHEYMPAFGMGEMAATLLMGKEEMSAGEIALNIASMMSEYSPLAVDRAGLDHALMPSAVKPLYEASINESWTGMPIYRSNPYNADMPEWTKAYSSTNHALVNLAERLNAWSGGDEYTKGAIDVNPAQVEYMLNGYLGGYAKMADRMMKIYETASGEREFEWRNMPLANVVVKQGDERTANRRITNDYFEYMNDYNRLKGRIRNYEKEAKDNVFEYARKLSELSQTPEYRRYWIIGRFDKKLRAIDRALKKAETEEQEEALTKERDELRKLMVEKVRGRYPLEDADTTGMAAKQEQYRKYLAQ